MFTYITCACILHLRDFIISPEYLIVLEMPWILAGKIFILFKALPLTLNYSLILPSRKNDVLCCCQELVKLSTVGPTFDYSRQVYDL